MLRHKIETTVRNSGRTVEDLVSYVVLGLTFFIFFFCNFCFFNLLFVEFFYDLVLLEA